MKLFFPISILLFFLPVILYSIPGARDHYRQRKGVCSFEGLKK